jgi:hypothetical protein
MRQRAALARALACQPEILLADEPFGALDAQSREILQRELQTVWLETRNTFVFVTHNVREAVFLADRVVLMSARPGTFIAEHRISSPRPRGFEDVLLAKVVVDIHDHLLKEVEQGVETEEGPRPIGLGRIVAASCPVVGRYESGTGATCSCPRRPACGTRSCRTWGARTGSSWSRTGACSGSSPVSCSPC